MQNILYSVIGILAFLVHIIINFDILWPGAETHIGLNYKSYRHFLYLIASFYCIDVFWGFAAETGNASLLYAASALYFFSLAVVVIFWNLFVIEYLGLRGVVRRVFLAIGVVIFVFIVVLLIINDFTHIFFWIDDEGIYQYGVGRAVTLAAHALLFLLTSIRTGYRVWGSEGSRRRRYVVVFSFGIVMVLAAAVQIPLCVFPIYSMGFTIGCCAIHTFIVEDARKEISLLLAEQKENAERANEAKTTFLFSMTHDIRTPMNAIMGYTELARKVPGNPPKTLEYMDKINMAEENLLGLINNVLEMARIESGAVVLNEKPSDISLDMNKTMMIFEGLAKEKNIKLTGHSNIENPYVMEDESLDAEIAINLVSNAIKYTNEGGSVDVYLNQHPTEDPAKCMLEFKVVDTGIGMTKEFLEHAFDNFSREKNSTDSKIQGAGLGLGIVKKLITQMGGTIDIQSEKGVGTTVTVHTYHRYCDKSQVIKPLEPNESIRNNFAGHKLLVVEDNELNLEIILGILNEFGIECESAANGKIACEMLMDRGPGYYDLIFMDIQMPVMNGFVATETIRHFGDAGLRNIPIIAMTANAFEEDQKNALKAGMNAHLAKPINISQLVGVLDKFLD